MRCLQEGFSLRQPQKDVFIKDVALNQHSWDVTCGKINLWNGFCTQLHKSTVFVILIRQYALYYCNVGVTCNPNSSPHTPTFLSSHLSHHSERLKHQGWHVLPLRHVKLAKHNLTLDLRDFQIATKSGAVWSSWLAGVTVIDKGREITPLLPVQFSFSDSSGCGIIKIWTHDLVITGWTCFCFQV